MKRPRVSIAGLMVLVALFAINGVVIQAGLRASAKVGRYSVLFLYSEISGVKNPASFNDLVPNLDTDRIAMMVALLAIGVTPMASLLGVGIAVLLSALLRRGRCSPFLLGAVTAGLATTAIYAAGCVLAVNEIERYAVAAVMALLYLPNQISGCSPSDGMVDAIAKFAMVLVLGFPQWAATLLGGLLNARVLRIALVTLPRAEAETGASSVSEQS